MEQQRNHVEFLIRAIDYFISHPNEEFYNDIPKKAVNYLVYEEIKLFDPQLKYKDFRKSTLEERKIRLESYLPKSVAATVPQNLGVFMEQLEEHELKISSEKQKGIVRRDYESAVNFIKQAQALVANDPEVSIEGAVDLALLPVAIDAKQKEDLLNRAKKDSVNLTQQVTDSLVVEVQPQNQQQISQIGQLAKNYVDQLATAQANTPFVIINAPQIKNNFEEGRTFVTEDVFTEIPQSTAQNQRNINQLIRIARTRPETLQSNLSRETGSDDFAGVFTSGVSNLTSVLPIIPIVTTTGAVEISLRAQEIVGQVTGPVAETVFSQATSTQSSQITETLTPFQSFMIPQAVQVSLPEAAKKDPVNATAKAFYYLHGYTKNTFNVVAKEVGLTPSQTKAFTDYLGTFETAHPDFAALLASERASLNSSQIERIFTGPGTLYQNYVGQVPPITGIRGLFLRASQQAFGKAADGLVNNSIKSGLAKAASGVVKKVVASGIAKAITAVVVAASDVVPFLGPLVTWIGTKIIGGILSRLGVWIKKHISSIAALLGGMGGLVFFGPVGLVAGALGGAALAGGIAAGSIAAGLAVITTGLAAMLAAFAAAILVPMLIIVIGIPITVVIVLFIINAGAYVVPGTTGNVVGNVTPGQIAACFKLGGLWDPTLANNIIEATQEMASQPKYIEKLCKNGDITLYYKPGAVTYGGLTLPPSTIYIGERGAASVASAFYTLSHESGHILASRTDLFQRYLENGSNLFTELDASGSKAGIICTYPIDSGDSYWGSIPTDIQFKKSTENFAEMMALYYTDARSATGTRSFGCLSGLGFKGRYPLHWGFANTTIFGN